MGEKRMYSYMCNWITMLNSGEKKWYWKNNTQKKTQIEI